MLGMTFIGPSQLLESRYSYHISTWRFSGKECGVLHMGILTEQMSLGSCQFIEFLGQVVDCQYIQIHGWQSTQKHSYMGCGSNINGLNQTVRGPVQSGFKMSFWKVDWQPNRLSLIWWIIWVFRRPILINAELLQPSEDLFNSGHKVSPVKLTVDLRWYNTNGKRCGKYKSLNFVVDSHHPSEKLCLLFLHSNLS